MNQMFLKLGLLALMLLLLSGCNGKDVAPEPEDPSTPVEVQTVTLGSISTENKLSGSIIADKTEQVYVALSARCSEVYVKEGDSVSAGQLICRLDLTSFHDNYEVAQLSYQNAVKSRDDQTVLLAEQILQQQKNYDNTLALFEIGAASQLEVDGAKLALDSAVVSRDSALAQLDLAVKNAEKGMKQITDTLNNVSGDGGIRAPIAGTIVSLSVGTDSYVSAGMPVAVIEAANSMKISLSVSENLISKLKVGDHAQVSLNALGRSFETTIEDISTAANPVNRLYTVLLTIPKGQSGLLSGMFADVSLFTDSREGAVVIPSEAILLQTQGQYVVVLNEDQSARRVSVETGLIGDGVTEITAGLLGGETLVVVGQSYLKDGDPTRVVSPQE